MHATALDPFHAGERALQARAGMRERLAQVGPRVVREAMPDQHRAFFRQLPFVVIGSVDAAGQPWASLLAGPPGFIDSPDPRRLTLKARADAVSPLLAAMRVGASLGLLGIEPQTRRRNRANGTVSALTGSGVEIAITQSFGNCPQYIQAREAHYAPREREPVGVARSNRLDPLARDIITRADTFFIASAHPDAATNAARSEGVDVSHRGGKPGFVHLDADDTLTVPDFSGNFFFNTLGNLAINPRAGLLFADFASGDLLHVAGVAEIIWDGPQVEAFAGAERLMKFRVLEVLRQKRAMPLTWSTAQLSPLLAATGSWQHAFDNCGARSNSPVVRQ